MPQTKISQNLTAKSHHGVYGVYAIQVYTKHSVANFSGEKPPYKKLHNIWKCHSRVIRWDVEDHFTQ